jgi:hypothetical protein
MVIGTSPHHAIPHPARRSCYLECATPLSTAPGAPQLVCLSCSVGIAPRWREAVFFQPLPRNPARRNGYFPVVENYLNSVGKNTSIPAQALTTIHGLIKMVNPARAF